MKFYVEWEEEAQVRTTNSGWVEALSEEEALEKVRVGDVEVDDCTVGDTLDSTVIRINNIYEDPE